jgi:hypothetical protein
MLFLQFYNYIPFEQGLVLYLGKLEFPLPKDGVYRVLIEIDLLVMEKILQYFSLFRYHLPLVKELTSFE